MLKPLVEKKFSPSGAEPATSGFALRTRMGRRQAGGRG